MSRLLTLEGQTHCAERFWHILSAFPSKLKPTTRMQFSSCFLENTGPCAPGLLRAPPRAGASQQLRAHPASTQAEIAAGPTGRGPRKGLSGEEEKRSTCNKPSSPPSGCCGRVQGGVGAWARLRAPGLEGGCRCRPASPGSAGTPS